MPQVERRTRSVITRALTQNIGFKLLALALSVALFSLVHGDVDAQRSIDVDVVALLPERDANKMLISELPAQVKVTLRGSRSKLSQLSRDDLSPLQLDLRSAGNGPFYIEASAFSLGSGVRVNDISPASVNLVWAVTAERRVPVQVQVEGAPQKGTQLGTPEVTPGNVVLRGPEEVLRGLASISTEPVSLFGLTLGKHQRRVPLQPLPAHVTSVGDGSVEAVIPIIPALGEVTLRHLEVATVGEGVYSVRPDQVAVRLTGSQETLDDIDPRAVVPYVDMTTVPNGTAPAIRGGASFTGTGAITVQVRGLPAGVEVAEIIPTSVLVAVKGKP